MARIETVRAVSGNDETVAGSFRDPAGFVFRRDGAILRHVAKSYGPIYDRLVASGLYQSMVSQFRADCRAIPTELLTQAAVF